MRIFSVRTCRRSSFGGASRECVLASKRHACYKVVLHSVPVVVRIITLSYKRPVEGGGRGLTSGIRIRRQVMLLSACCYSIGSIVRNVYNANNRETKRQ